jgi:AcrR family transcriptional regulator
VPATSHRDPRVERTTTTILSAVQHLLETEGIESVTFGRVSRVTGVSRTTMYRHWSSPTDLIIDAWSRLAPPNVVDHTDDLHADLCRLFVGIRDVVESPAMRRSLPALLALAQRDPTVAALHAEFVRQRRRPIVERLEAALNEGRLAPGADPELMTDLLSGPLFYRQLLRHEPTTDDQVETLVAAVLRAAAP